jgi:hypothetical protein
MMRALRFRFGFIVAMAMLASAFSSDAATAAKGPFYLVPAPTHECVRVKNCVAVTGPWVVVPATQPVSFLFGCPTRHGFTIGGTDARASSMDVRVWYDGGLGSASGFPPINAKGGSVLLFHAASENTRLSWFQPVLGCVSLTPKNKRSTLAVLPGKPPASPLDLRAINVELFPGAAKGLVPSTPARCLRNEKLVGSWIALAFARTGGPPDLAYASAVSYKAVRLGNRVQGTVRLNRSMPYMAEVQIGAMCEPVG